MNKDYCLKLDNIRKGISILMNNPDMVILAENKKDYNGYSEIKIHENQLVEEVFEGYMWEYESKRYPVTIDDRECFIPVYEKENFIYVMNKWFRDPLGCFELLEYNDIYELIFNDDEKAIEICKFVYYDFLRDVIINDTTLNKELRESLYDILED